MGNFTGKNNHLPDLPEDLLSLLIFTFFPEQHRHYYSKYVEALTDGTFYIKNESECKNFLSATLLTGSVTEGLDLPPLCKYTNRILGYETIVPDVDSMYELYYTFIFDGEFNQCTDFFSVYCFKDQPLFCKMLVNNSLQIHCLDSHKLNSMFRYIRFGQWSSLPGQTGRTATTTSSEQIWHAGQNIAEHTAEQDGVLAIPIHCPGQISQDFVNRIRFREFPQPVALINQLLNRGGCHVIPKSYPGCTEAHLSWRISFSVLEQKLASFLNDTQRICYRVLKAVVKSAVNDHLPKEQKLPSYYLKTVLFWKCEGTRINEWTASNCWHLWSCLLDKLLFFLENGFLPHYFVPVSNLLMEHSTDTISYWIASLTALKQNPLVCLNQFWDRYTVIGNYHMILKSYHRYIYDFVLQGNLYYPVSDILIYLLCECNFSDLIRMWKELNINSRFLEIHAAKLHLHDLHYSETKEVPFLIQVLERVSELTKSDFLISRFPWLQAHKGELICIRSLWQSHLGNLYYQEFKNNKVPLFEKKAFEYHNIACEGFGLNFTSCKIKHVISALYKSNILLQSGPEDYIEAVEMVITIIRMRGNVSGIRFSRYTPAVLDEYLLLELGPFTETDRIDAFLVYHILCVAYIKAGVLAEVCLPSGYQMTVQDEDDTSVDVGESFESFLMMDNFMRILAAQYLLLGRYFKAYQCFNQFKRETTLKRWGKMYCLTKLFQPCFLAKH